MTEPEPQPAANPQAGVTEEMVQAVARSDAEFDKRPFGSLGRIDRERYTERARKALTAALSLSRPAADRGQIVEAFRGGLEAAARWHESQAVRPPTAVTNINIELHQGYADAIRALSPAPAQTEE